MKQKSSRRPSGLLLKVTLALILIISQTLLIIHANGHIEKDSVVCQLCVSQGQQSHGLSVFITHFTAIEGRDCQLDTEIQLLPDLHHPRPYYQRAPPVIA